MALNNFDEFIDKTDFLQTRLLQVNSCGSERVVKYDYTILRSNGRRDYHFLYRVAETGNNVHQNCPCLQQISALSECKKYGTL